MRVDPDSSGILERGGCLLFSNKRPPTHLRIVLPCGSHMDGKWGHEVKWSELNITCSAGLALPVRQVRRTS